MDREKQWIPEKDRWFEFNDECVEKYDPEDIKNDAFGGEEKWGGFEGFQGRKFEKIRNAYLLVYDRVAECEVPEEEGEGDNKTTGPPAKVGMKGSPLIPDAIHRAVTADNLKYLQSKYVFGTEYLEFVRKMLLGLDTKNNIGITGMILLFIFISFKLKCRAH